MSRKIWKQLRRLQRDLDQEILDAREVCTSLNILLRVEGMYWVFYRDGVGGKKLLSYCRATSLAFSRGDIKKGMMCRCASYKDAVEWALRLRDRG